MATTSKQNTWVVLDNNGNFQSGDKVDSLKMYPEHHALYEALKEGRSCYDIMYPHDDGLISLPQKRHISTVKNIQPSKRPEKKARKL
jgi:hypothetical protein